MTRLTLAASTRLDPAPLPEPPRRTRRPRGQQAPALVALLVTAAGLGLPNPTLTLLGGALAAASIMRRWLPWDTAVPAGVLALLTASTVTGTLAGLARVDLLGRPLLAAAPFATLAAAALLVSRAPGRPSGATPAGVSWVACLPAAAAGVIGLAQSLSGRMTPSWAFDGTDFSQHLLYLRDIQLGGSLSYDITSYPRAFHLLLAFASVRAPVHDPAALLDTDLRLLGSGLWLCLALVLWTATALVFRLGARFGVSRSVCTGAAVALGAAVLCATPLLVVFVYLGAGASQLALVVLWTLPLIALTIHDHRAQLLVTVAAAAASTFVLAHLWQTLGMIPAFALAGFVWARGPRSIRRSLGSRGARVWLGCLALAGAALVPLTLLPLASIQAAGGLALAAQAGNIPQTSSLVLSAGLVAAFAVSFRLPAAARGALLGTLTGIGAAAAVMMYGAHGGFDLRPYYVMKVLWLLTVFTAPALALAGGDLATRLCGRVSRSLAALGRPAFVARAAALSVVAALTFAFVLPALLGAGTGALHALARPGPTLAADAAGPGRSVSRERLDIALAYSRRYAPAVTVPVGVAFRSPLDNFSTNVVARLMSFQTGQIPNYGVLTQVCDEIETVAGDRAAVVITQLPARDVRAALREQGCGSVPVRRIGTGHGPGTQGFTPRASASAPAVAPATR